MQETFSKVLKIFQKVEKCCVSFGLPTSLSAPTLWVRHCMVYVSLIRFFYTGSGALRRGAAVQCNAYGKF